MSKIPNYDPSFGEHLLKVIKSHLHKGNYVSELKISMQDLLNGKLTVFYFSIILDFSKEHCIFELLISLILLFS